LDSLGHSDEALRELRSAITATEVRRNAVPFLGWSRLGTPLRLLLTRASDDGVTRWAAELDAADHPDLVASLGPTTATPHERSHTSDAVVRPVLTPREREVLLELARGATYADISTTLLVTENTVKTHVSSLYAKLAVSRRSEALAVARTLRLV
jgi:DNA-binding CsgD family transcriptional regulator